MTDNIEYNRGYNAALDNVRKLLFEAGKDAFGWGSDKSDPIINDVINHLKTLTDTKVTTWESLSTEQKYLLVSASMVGETTFGIREESRVKSSEQLEDMGLVKIGGVPARQFPKTYTLHITEQGREVCKGKSMLDIAKELDKE